MMNRLAVLASLPSPSSGSLEIGPLRLNAYGAIIAIGVVVAVMVTGRRFEKRGIAKREDASSIALWAVPAGVIGGRLYHVITDWDRFRDDPLKAIEIWKGGLGIWGGIALGVLVGVIVAKSKSIPIAAALTCVAPALAFAQSIGHWSHVGEIQLVDVAKMLEHSGQLLGHLGELSGRKIESRQSGHLGHHLVVDTRFFHALQATERRREFGRVLWRRAS